VEKAYNQREFARKSHFGSRTAAKGEESGTTICCPAGCDDKGTAITETTIGECRAERAAFSPHAFRQNQPRFQEDEELYMEKERNQRAFARRMDRENSMRANWWSCPVGCLGSPPPGLGCEIGIGGVEDEIKIVSGKSWRQDQVKSEEVMIQNLEKNPTTICVDSGAGESVCPVDFFPDYETHDTEKVGNLYRAAGGQELRNVGEKRPKLKINGVAASMTFQATSHVRKPLAAASKITAKGNRIVLDDEESLSYIENKATGTRIPLKIQNGVYVMEVTVTPKKAPF